MGSSILVVDDDEDMRTMLCVVLAAEGYQVEGSANGIDALRRIRADAVPSLMLVDLMMPGMSGEDLIGEMKQDPSLARIPVAIVSGQLTPGRALSGPSIIARLSKPIELDRLLTVVRQFADAEGPRRAHNDGPGEEDGR